MSKLIALKLIILPISGIEIGNSKSQFSSCNLFRLSRLMLNLVIYAYVVNMLVGWSLLAVLSQGMHVSQYIMVGCDLRN